MIATEKEKKIPTCRVPSEGQRLNIKKMSFKVIKTRGFSFKAQTDLKGQSLTQDHIISNGATFVFMGTKFKVGTYQLRNNKATLSAQAI